mmetsp:Transcript_21550/g.42796  ORF Transcript_21550/g.42796 Transcript_21550/m.42796 type:complete len:307 (-) Transcript_21550:36-956(-)
MADLLESVCHTADGHHTVGLGDQVLNHQQLVRDLRTSHDCQEGSLDESRVENLLECVQLFLQKEPRHTGHLALHADHGGVRTVSSAEGIVDIHVSEGAERSAESRDFFFCGLGGLAGELGLLALLILAAVGVINALSLLLLVEAQILQKNDRSRGGISAGCFHLCTNTVGQEGHRLAQKLLKLLADNSQGHGGHLLAIGAAEMGHEDNGLGSAVKGMLDGGECSDNALGVGDRTTLVEGHVEVNAHQNAFALDINVRKALLAQGHGHLGRSWRHKGDGCCLGLCSASQQRELSLNRKPSKPPDTNK